MVQAGRWVGIIIGLLGTITFARGILNLAIGLPSGEAGLRAAFGVTAEQSSAYLAGYLFGYLGFGGIATAMTWGLFRWRTWGRTLASFVFGIFALICIIMLFSVESRFVAVPTLLIVSFLLTWSFLPRVKEAFAKRGKPPTPQGVSGV